jgi:peptide/nickel transport system substrate-binding protein
VSGPSGPRDRPGRRAGRAPGAALLPALAVAGACCGCGSFTDPAATLTVAIDNGPASLDPRLGSDEASRRVNDLLYNGLFRLDGSARPVPDLAERVHRPDGRTLVVTLRAGVLFHDGAPLTSGDVVATYRSILADEVPSFRKGDLQPLAAVEAPDPLTVVLRLREPFAPILTNLNVPILRAGAGPRAARRPVGTGPFLLVRHRQDEDLLLRRFDRHFAGRAGVEYLRLRIVPSETARLLELLKGSVDLVVNDLSPDQVARVRRTPGFAVDSLPGRNYVYLAFNFADPLLADRRVRRAIAHAIDREAVVRHLLRGAATPATGMLPPHHWAYEPDVPRFPHDPPAARRLLDAAGLPDPDGPGPEVRFRLLYKTSTSELAQQQAAILQQQLAAVGIGVDIRAFEWPTFYEDLKAGRFQVAVSMWTEINDPDVFRLRFHSRHRPPAGLNRGGYSSPAADRLIEAGARTLDESERRRIYGRLQALLARDLPYVSLWHRDVVAARRLRVRGFRLTPGADFAALREVRLDPGPGGGSVEPAAQDVADGGDRHRPGADHPGDVRAQVEHGRGQPSGGRAAVQEQGHGVAEGLDDLGRGLGRRPAGAVGAGGYDGAAGGARQGGGDRVRRDAHPDRPPAAEQPRRQVGGGGQDESQGAGPEGRRQAPGAVGEGGDAHPDRVLVGGDQRQGHALGPALRLEHPLHRLGVARVGPQGVEGLGRIGDQQAALQERGGLRDAGGLGMFPVYGQRPGHRDPRDGMTGRL